MTVNNLVEKLELEIINLADGEAETEGVYTGDLLSWVMGRADSGNVWVTIMTNVNVCAVASLAGTSCVIIAENAELQPELVERAKQQRINILRSPLNSYQLCVKLSEIIK